MLEVKTLDSETLAALMAHLPVPFVTVEDGLCSYANDAARQVLGDEVVGQPREAWLTFWPCTLEGPKRPGTPGALLDTASGPEETERPGTPGALLGTASGPETAERPGAPGRFPEATEPPGRLGSLPEGRRFLGRTRHGRIVKGCSYTLPNGICGIAFADATEEQRAQREAMAFAKMASGMKWSGTLDETMASLARHAAEAVDAVAALVILHEGNRPRISGSHNLPDLVQACIARRWQRQDKENFWASVMQSGKILVKANVRETSLHDPDLLPAAEYLRTAPWDTLVIVPMIYQDIRLGTLNCYFPECTGGDEEELRFLQAIADQAAVLVQNARMIHELRDKALLEERQRLARELHDSVSQALYGIALGARTARALLDRDPATVAEPLDYVLSLAEAGLAEMRALIFELRPETIDSEGLVAALERQLAALQARHQLTVTRELPAEPALSSEGRHALYRVAQEAMINIVKHAGASLVDLHLTAENGTVTLRIADNGRGFDGPGDVPGHLGLRSMRERMAGVGGSLAVHSEPGSGTQVVAALSESR